MSPTRDPVAADVDLAAEALGPLGERDVPIGPLTTYRVGGPAALFVRIGHVDDLGVLASAVHASVR